MTQSLLWQSCLQTVPLHHDGPCGPGPPPPPIPPRSTRPDYQPPHASDLSHDSGDLSDDEVAGSNKSLASTDSLTSQFDGLSLTRTDSEPNSVNRRAGDCMIVRYPRYPTEDNLFIEFLIPRTSSTSMPSPTSDVTAPPSADSAQSSTSSSSSCPTSSPTSSYQNIRVPNHATGSDQFRGKRKCFYVVTKGRRTGVFNNWPYVDAITKGINNCHQSFSSKEDAVQAFHDAQRIGLVRQTGSCPPELLTNCPRDLSSE